MPEPQKKTEPIKWIRSFTVKAEGVPWKDVKKTVRRRKACPFPGCNRPVNKAHPEEHRHEP